MVRWCRTFLCLVSITVCVATTIAMDDEMHVLREGMLFLCHRNIRVLVNHQRKPTSGS